MSRVTEIEWLRALHFAEVRLPIKNLNDALHKARDICSHASGSRTA